MMKYLSILFFFFAPVVSFSQDHKLLVKEQFMKYLNCIRNKDFTKATDYMNPAFFKLISKDELIKAMDKTFNMPDMEFVIGESEVLMITEKKRIDKEDYVKLDYTSHLKIRFTSDASGLPDTSVLKSSFESTFGKGNVAYEASTGYYMINTIKHAVANSADGSKWTFIVVEDRQRPILEGILPKEILE